MLSHSSFAVCVGKSNLLTCHIWKKKFLQENIIPFLSTRSIISIRIFRIFPGWKTLRLANRVFKGRTERWTGVFIKVCKSSWHIFCHIHFKRYFSDTKHDIDLNFFLLYLERKVLFFRAKFFWSCDTLRMFEALEELSFLLIINVFLMTIKFTPKIEKRKLEFSNNPLQVILSDRYLLY